MIELTGRCATCRWWTPDIHGYEEPPVGWQFCGLATDREATMPAQKMGAWYDSGYIAGVYTAPDFGCVQWEAQSS